MMWGVEEVGCAQINIILKYILPDTTPCSPLLFKSSPGSLARLMLSIPFYHLQKLLRDDSKHLRLNMNKYNLEDMIAECEEYIQRLRSLAIEVSGSDVASSDFSACHLGRCMYQVCV